MVFPPLLCLYRSFLHIGTGADPLHSVSYKLSSCGKLTYECSHVPSRSPDARLLHASAVLCWCHKSSVLPLLRARRHQKFRQADQQASLERMCLHYSLTVLELQICPGPPLHRSIDACPLSAAMAAQFAAGAAELHHAACACAGRLHRPPTETMM